MLGHFKMCHRNEKFLVFFVCFVINNVKPNQFECVDLLYKQGQITI